MDTTRSYHMEGQQNFLFLQPLSNSLSLDACASSEQNSIDLHIAFPDITDTAGVTTPDW
jgi:hypothetical protein